MNWKGCEWNRWWLNWGNTLTFADMTRGEIMMRLSQNRRLGFESWTRDLLNTKQERLIRQYIRLDRVGPWGRCKQREIIFAGQEGDLLGCRVYLLVINRLDYGMLKRVCLNVMHHVMSSRTYFHSPQYLNVLHSFVVQLICLHISACLKAVRYVVAHMKPINNFNALYYVLSNCYMSSSISIFECCALRRGSADTCLHVSACLNVVHYVVIQLIRVFTYQHVWMLCIT
jgi:hypothetical protein